MHFNRRTGLYRGGRQERVQTAARRDVESDFKADENNRVENAPEDFLPALEGRVMQITSAPNRSKRRIFRTLPVSGAKNSAFTFGGWAKAFSLPGEDAGTPYFDPAVTYRQKPNGRYSKPVHLTFNKGTRERHR